MLWSANYLIILAGDAFVRTNRRAMRLLSWCSFVCPSVCLGRTCIVIIRCTLARIQVYGWIGMFLAPGHQSMSTYSQPSFSNSTWKRGGVWMCKLGVIFQERLKIEVKLLLSANRKSYMPHRLAQQRMTLSDLEWQHHPHRALCLR